MGAETLPNFFRAKRMKKLTRCTVPVRKATPSVAQRKIEPIIWFYFCVLMGFWNCGMILL